MRSLINLTQRENKAGEITYQARFYNKSGDQIKSLSVPPHIKSRSEAYLWARNKVEAILFPAISKEEIKQHDILAKKEEIKQHDILTIDEVKKILALPDESPTTARDTLMALLGITCGLGDSEICGLEREQITASDMIQIGTGCESRYIPIIGNVKIRYQRMLEHFPKGRYVIPNLRNYEKPCNPSSINEGIKAVNSEIGISLERYIVPSTLKYTFITLLAACNKEIEMETIDYLCGFSNSMTELTYDQKSNIIKAIDKMMIDLEDRPYSSLPEMKWQFP